MYLYAWRTAIFFYGNVIILERRENMDSLFKIALRLFSAIEKEKGKKIFSVLFIFRRGVQ